MTERKTIRVEIVNGRTKAWLCILKEKEGGLNCKNGFERYKNVRGSYKFIKRNVKRKLVK